MLTLRDIVREDMRGARQSAAVLSFTVPANVALGLRWLILTTERRSLTRIIFGDVAPNDFDFYAEIDGVLRPARFTIREGSYEFRYNPPTLIDREAVFVIINNTTLDKSFQMYWEFVAYPAAVVEKEMEAVLRGA